MTRVRPHYNIDRETILDIYITLLLSQNQHYITITITCILESNALHYNYIVLYQRNIYIQCTKYTSLCFL